MAFASDAAAGMGCNDACVRCCSVAADSVVGESAFDAGTSPVQASAQTSAASAKPSAEALEASAEAFEGKATWYR